MGYDLQTGLGGATTGAGLGGSIGGPVGAGIGAVAGLGMGFFGKKRKDTGYNKEEIDRVVGLRAEEINRFSSQLAAARGRYLSSIQNLSMNSWNRFVPNTESQYASRGLNVTGGAFQSALGRKAADLQASMDVDYANRENADIKSVDAAWQNLRGTQMSGMFGQPYQEASNPLASSLFGLGGTLLGGQINEYGSSMRDWRKGGKVGPKPTLFG